MMAIHDRLSRVMRRIPLNITSFFLLSCVILAILLPDFRRFSNLSNILRQSAVLGIMALGQTFVILLGGIDLSVGAVGALCGALTVGMVVKAGVSPLMALLIVLLIGMLIGACNGLLVFWFRLPPFVATLSTMAISRGATLVYTNGAPIASDHPQFIALAGAEIGGISISAGIMFALFAIGAVVMRYTTYGLHLYATGANAHTARLSGVAVSRITLSAYLISGACAALGGVLLASRLWSAQPIAGTGFELQTIAAVVLGGSSLFGGIGTVGGTLVGTLVLGVLSNGMNLFGVPAYVQRVIGGLILIIAVAFDLKVRTKR